MNTPLDTSYTDTEKNTSIALAVALLALIALNVIFHLILKWTIRQTMTIPDKTLIIKTPETGDSLVDTAVLFDVATFQADEDILITDETDESRKAVMKRDDSLELVSIGGTSDDIDDEQTETEKYNQESTVRRTSSRLEFEIDENSQEI